MGIKTFVKASGNVLDGVWGNVRAKSIKCVLIM